jgi:hypothetical protein
VIEALTREHLGWPRRRVEQARSAPQWRVIAVSGSIIALLVAVHVANRLTVNAELLRLDAEANLPTWFSSLQFALAGAACLAVAVARRRASWPWGLLGALMVLLSLDEVATLHERLSAQVGGTLAEVVIQPVAGLAVIALFVVVGRRAERTARRLLLAAAAALLLGHAAELATPPPEEGHVAAALKIAEESFEMMLGALVLAAAVAGPRHPAPPPLRETASYRR